jgi:hypothetical protein
MIQSMDCDRKELLESLVSGKAPRHPSWNSKVDLIGDIGEAKLNGNDVIVGTMNHSHRGDVMATHQHRMPAAQTLDGVIRSSAKRSKRPAAKRVRNEQWERRIEEDWQGHLETLRQCICELLIGNRRLRMKRMETDQPSQE